MKRNLQLSYLSLAFIVSLVALTGVASGQDQAGNDDMVDIQTLSFWWGRGDDNKWSTSRNWRRGVAVDGDSVDFQSNQYATVEHDRPAGSSYSTVTNSGNGGSDLTLIGNRLGLISGASLRNTSDYHFIITADIDFNGNNSIQAYSPITLTGLVTIADNHTLSIFQDDITHISGAISGQASIFKDDTGTLKLSGANSFTNGVSFEKGYIIAGHDNALGTGTLHITASGVVTDTYLTLLNGINLANEIILDQSTYVLVETDGVATLSGNISGDYGIALTQGHLVLAGSNTFEGNISVDNATLSMTSQLETSDITINEGGTMSGVFGGRSLHALSGNVTPNGNAIGSMQVQNEFALRGSTLQVQLDNQGNADKIIADTATLESGTILAKPTEVITSQRDYIIIQTTNGIAGDPADLTRLIENDSFLLDYSLAINGNNLVLTSVPQSSFEDAAQSTGNRQLSSIGLILDRAVTNGNNSDQLASLQNLNEVQLTQALGQLQPKLSQAVAMRQMNTQANVNQQWQSRTQQAHYAMRDAIKSVQSTWLAQGPSATGANPGHDDSALAAAIGLMHDNQPQVGKIAIFAKQMNDFGRVSEDRFASGYSYDAHGTDIGAQMLLSEHFLMGASGSFNLNKIRGHDDSGTAESLTLTANLYASYLTRNWQADAGFSYGHAFNESHRPITALGITADGDYDSDILAFTLGGGYTFDLKGFEIKPFAYISYTNVIDHGYSETGAGGLNLAVSQNHTDSLKPLIGIRLGKRFEFRAFEYNIPVVFTPRLSASYEYEVLDTQIGVDANLLGATFRNEGADISRHTLRLGAGGDLKFTHNLSIFLDYVASLNNDFLNHSINAGLRVSF